MGFSGITKNQGKDFNYFNKTSVNWSTFGGGAPDGYGPDQVITFSTQGVMFLNENSSGVVEFSMNGHTVHGELDPTLPSRGLIFDNRVVSLIWFRVKSGSSGPIVISTTAWALR